MLQNKYIVMIIGIVVLVGIAGLADGNFSCDGPTPKQISSCKNPDGSFNEKCLEILGKK